MPKVALIESVSRLASTDMSKPLYWTDSHQTQWSYLRQVELERLQRTMRMREIASFALKLQSLGSQSEWQELTHLANDLHIDVMAFNLFGVQIYLHELSRWPEQFEATA